MFEAKSMVAQHPRDLPYLHEHNNNSANFFSSTTFASGSTSVGGDFVCHIRARVGFCTCFKMIHFLSSLNPFLELEKTHPLRGVDGQIVDKQTDVTVSERTQVTVSERTVVHNVSAVSILPFPYEFRGCFKEFREPVHEKNVATRFTHELTLDESAACVVRKVINASVFGNEREALFPQMVHHTHIFASKSRARTSSADCSVILVISSSHLEF
jgi:hypothetical protein